MIYIIGINGKGLMVVMIRDILGVSGLCVGIFMLFFIICYNEWMVIDGQLISDEDLIWIVNWVVKVVMVLDQELMEGGLIEFEIGMVIMFCYMNE